MRAGGFLSWNFGECIVGRNRAFSWNRRRETNQPRLGVERLEPRLMMAGDVYQINFQLDGAAVPHRYLPDIGAVYGDRGGGLSYGWNVSHAGATRDRNLNADQRLDTLSHFLAGGVWELGLPNGNYEVTVSIGDAQFASTYKLNVEGTNYWGGPTGAAGLSLGVNEFRAMTQQITVNDGRLTLDQGDLGAMATRINYIQVIGLASGANGSPVSPTINEPASEGQVLNPNDVHMEALNYSDTDVPPDAHKSTDWEIWTTGPSPVMVWQTLGIGSIERYHTHFGDGIFMGPQAGQTGLAGNTDYQLSTLR